MKYAAVTCVLLSFCGAAAACAEPAGATHEAETQHPPTDITTSQALQLPDRMLRFTATAGSIRLRDSKDLPLTDIDFVAYQTEVANVDSRPVTFVFNGGPGMASAWLQMGGLGPWRVRLETASDGPSAAAPPVPNADTWLDFTDLVFIDPPGTGYSRILTTDADARRRLLSVNGDIDVLAEAVRRWLDHNNRGVSPKYIVGESYGGFRGPRLARELQSEQGVGINGLVLLSPLLDAHVMSGFVDPLGWVDLLPTEVAVLRAKRGPIAWTDMFDVETYAAGEYLVDLLRGGADAAAVDRLTTRVAAMTGFDPALVRRLGGRLDRAVFQRNVAPGQVSSAYDGTITRPDPAPRAQAGGFPDPVLNGFEAPVTSAMMAIYAGKLNWRPETTYHLASDTVASAWDWGRGIGRPESLSALNAARSVDPHMRVLIAHGLFDLVTPYFATQRMLRLMPALDGAAPIVLRVYPGGHMFYFNDQSRAALRQDAKAVFDPDNQTGVSQ